MKVDELVALGGVVPPTPGSPPTPDLVDEIVKLFYEVYMPGLTLFFETQWYDFRKDQPGAKNPLSILRDNEPLINLFASFLHNIQNIKTTDPRDMIYSGHLETRVVWSLACLVYAVVPANASNAARPPTDPPPPEDDPDEAHNRLFVFDALLTGETLLANPLTPPSSTPAGHPAGLARANEFEFWYQMAEFLLQANSADAPAREHSLARIRAVLDGRENRDVLYSIAILRELTPQFHAGLNEQTVPAHLDESDPRSKLAVATRFIRDEATSTGGTTNVVRRFAELAYKAYVRPGVNVAKRS
jgi:hypothetical protein